MNKLSGVILILGLLTLAFISITMSEPESLPIFAGFLLVSTVLTTWFWDWEE